MDSQQVITKSADNRPIHHIANAAREEYARLFQLRTNLLYDLDIINADMRILEQAGFGESIDAPQNARASSIGVLGSSAR